MAVANFTYGADPENDTRDAVRYLIGDTEEDAPLIDDNEIAYSLSVKSDNVTLAAAQAARAIAAKLSRVAGMQADGVTYGRSAEYYLKLATELEQQAARGGGSNAVMPFAGGISQTDKDDRASDTDVVQPSFTRTIFATGSTGEVGGNAAPTDNAELE